MNNDRNDEMSENTSENSESTPVGTERQHPQGKAELPGILYGMAGLCVGVFVFLLVTINGAVGAQMSTQERLTTNALGYGVAAGQEQSLAPLIILMAVSALAVVALGVTGHKLSKKGKTHD